MSDYYPVLQRAVAGLQTKSPGARRVLYDRARRALLAQLRAVDPPLPDANIRTELLMLEAAIRRIEREPVQFAAADDAAGDEPVRRPPTFLQEPEQADAAAAWARPRRSRAQYAAAAACLLGGIAILGAVAAYSHWTSPRRAATADAGRLAAKAKIDATPAIVTAPAPHTDAAPPPAVVASSYIYRRQPVYYRSTHPAGAVVVDKSQRFLYEVRSNVLAIRYGIGVGADCTGVSGIFRVSRKFAWPDSATASAAATQAGGSSAPPGPYGTRAIYFGTDAERIHGTNTPRFLGQLAPSGCFALINDDVVDLYDRVAIDARVVVSN